MTMHQWIFGVGGGLLTTAFLIFAFRQGSRIRRSQGGGGSSDYTAGSDGGSNEGGSSDGGGGN